MNYPALKGHNLKAFASVVISKLQIIDNFQKIIPNSLTFTPWKLLKIFYKSLAPEILPGPKIQLRQINI